ncbi:MAG: hypothetical protein ABR509_05000 [Candidatus Limnocylindria bacterium]
MSEPRAKLFINSGIVSSKSDIYSILRPLLKQTVSYTYYRGLQVLTSGAGWVERLVVDRPDVASYFTPLAICLNLDSFDYLEFDTKHDQLLTYTLVLGTERVVIEYATSAPQLDGQLDGTAPADRRASDSGFVQMELMALPDEEEEP